MPVFPDFFLIKMISSEVSGTQQSPDTVRQWASLLIMLFPIVLETLHASEATPLRHKLKPSPPGLQPGLLFLTAGHSELQILYAFQGEVKPHRAGYKVPQPSSTGYTEQQHPFILSVIPIHQRESGSIFSKLVISTLCSSVDFQTCA